MFRKNERTLFLQEDIPIHSFPVLPLPWRGQGRVALLIHLFPFSFSRLRKPVVRKFHIVLSASTKLKKNLLSFLGLGNIGSQPKSGNDIL